MEMFAVRWCWALHCTILQALVEIEIQRASKHKQQQCEHSNWVWTCLFLFYYPVNLISFSIQVSLCVIRYTLTSTYTVHRSLKHVNVLIKYQLPSLDLSSKVSTVYLDFSRLYSSASESKLFLCLCSSFCTYNFLNLKSWWNIHTLTQTNVFMYLLYLWSTRWIQTTFNYIKILQRHNKAAGIECLFLNGVKWDSKPKWNRFSKMK
jgi:hypothetical protein